MSRFFNFFAVLCAFLLGSSLFLGHFHSALGVGVVVHLLVGLTAALLSVSLHCLVFGIFTGAGKDTRELVQDLSLNPEWVGATKAFRRVAFPPALYAILLLVLTTSLGGALSVSSSPAMRWIHLGLAWATFLYNLKAFWVEARCVRDNAAILKRVNQEATTTIVKNPEVGKTIPDLAGVIAAATEAMEWGAHVFALGKFLCFLGWNTWLPFLYLKYIVGYFMMPFWPFLVVSLGLLGGGYYLRWRYQSFRPAPLAEAPNH